MPIMWTRAVYCKDSGTAHWAHAIMVRQRAIQSKFYLFFWVDVMNIYMNMNFLKFSLIWCSLNYFSGHRPNEKDEKDEILDQYGFFFFFQYYNLPCHSVVMNK
jgi:hypothetical protein